VTKAITQTIEAARNALRTPAPTIPSSKPGLKWESDNSAQDAAVLDLHNALIAAGWTASVKGSGGRLNGWTEWTAPGFRDKIELAMGRIKVQSEERANINRIQRVERIERENAR